MFTNKEYKRKDIQEFVLYLFLLFPCFKISYLNVIFSFFEKLCNIWLVVSFLVVVILILKKYKLSKPLVFISLYYLVLIISTIVNGGPLITAFVLTLKGITLCLITDYGIKNSMKNFLNSFEFLTSILVYINFFSILLYPTGLYIDYSSGYAGNFILGFKNFHILYILVAILISFINSYYRNSKLKLRNYLLLITSLLTLILTNASTGIVGITIIIIYILLNKMFQNTKLFNIYTYYFSSIILFINIIILRTQEIFSYFIINILKKDITFTGRTYIWDYCIEFIKRKPLIGYGCEDSNLRLLKTNTWQSVHAHNEYLEIMYKTGIVGLIIFLIILLMSIKELYKYRESKLSKFIAITLFAYFIIMLTEYFSLEYFIFILIIAYNVKFLNQEYKV